MTIFLSHVFPKSLLQCTAAHAGELWFEFCMSYSPGDFARAMVHCEVRRCLDAALPVRVTRTFVLSCCELGGGSGVDGTVLSVRYVVVGCQMRIRPLAL